jgi:cytochrome b561
MNALSISTQRYTQVAIGLHWFMALLILFNLSIGWFMNSIAQPLHTTITGLHALVGLTVLALTCARILWRLTHRPPPFPDTLHAWERFSAHAAHGLLYVLMFGMTLTGWSIVSAHAPSRTGGPLNWLFHIPPIGPISHLDPVAQKAAHAQFVTLHTIGGWIFIGLLVLHVLGALKHQWFDRYPELARMGVGRADRTT